MNILWDLTTWWLVFGIASALLIRMFASRREKKTKHDLQDFLTIFMGPLPIIAAGIQMINGARTLKKLGKFASLTIIHYTTIQEYHLYVNQTLTVKNISRDLIVKFVPQMRLYQNFTMIATSNDKVVSDLSELDIKGVRNVN